MKTSAGRPAVAVVMPAYDEEGLGEFLAEVEHHLAPHTSTLTFVVVDDCSTRPLDVGTRTGRLAQGSRVHVRRNPSNLGHGPTAVAAYRAGLELSPDVIMHVDGDGQFLGEDFPRLLARLESLADMAGVVGSRHGRHEPWFRRVLTRAARVTVGRGLTGEDVNSPLRAYRVDALRLLLAELPEPTVVPHLHFAMLHRRLVLAVEEMSVTHRPRRGHSTLGTTWRSGPRLTFLPTRRLATLSWQALLELRFARRTSLPVQTPVRDVTADAA
jgi:glycosyltransferase involved in cell wall biosynthesis